MCISALTASFTMPPSHSLFLIGMLTGAKKKETSAGIHIISTSPKSIPNMMLMDNYSAYIPRQHK